MTASLTASSHPAEAVRLDHLCNTVFDSIPRSDQRRWAAAYVEGLVRVPGRKSIRRIAEQVAGPSTEQCLQQFVNQSPWRWAPVRHSLNQAVEAEIRPTAWVVQEIAFPKSGRHSVGVDTQYVPAAGRTFNCQMGLATWSVGRDGSVPVNWRLMLPPSWDADEARRRKAGVPDSERHRRPWEHILCAVDEMIESWGVPPRPVISDRRHDPRLEPLVRGLEERGLTFAVRISDRTAVTRSSVLGAAVRGGDLIRSAARGLIALPPDHATGDRRFRRAGSPVVAHAAVPQAGAAPRSGPCRARPRRVVARWPHGRTQPGELWLTNIGIAPLPDLLDAFDLPERTHLQCSRIRRSSGLDHFEGRSYAGWHHHVTLASVAHAHLELSDLDSGSEVTELRPVR